ncbi:Hypothetical predicted protein [Octopus vulgaris]|uniref:Uncharacterized protein n=1 Tax=Octopus vulgaris TaxID=6645 RepID=A0AA36FKJ5_OCTVU|nr:Hypothetical predicted protein [Octopus vulgaris]
MVTVPNRREIFQLKQQDLMERKVWQSGVPYSMIWRKVGNIYWCVHNELIECHCIKIDGDQVSILESISLLKFDSGLQFPSFTSQRNNEIFSNELINRLKDSGGEGRRGKSGEIVCKGRLKVRCGNYVAESMSGIDEISVRRLPYRTAMVPLSIPTLDEPVNYDYKRDNNSKLIKLDGDVSVLVFRDTATVITTRTGDILQHKQLRQQPQDICWWTNDCFILAFGEQLMFFNRDLSPLGTISTLKYYNRIYRNNDKQLVCGGHYIKDRMKRKMYNYYVDVVDVDYWTGKYNREVCSGVRERVEVEEIEMLDIIVTSDHDIVVMKIEKERWRKDGHYVVCWYREHLVRSIKLPTDLYYYMYRPYLTTHGDHVYITDKYNNIYQIPGDTEQQTSEDIEQYLLLTCDDNEVYKVIGFDISGDSFVVFGIIPGRQSFAFFHYDT